MKMPVSICCLASTIYCILAANTVKVPLIISPLVWDVGKLK